MMNFLRDGIWQFVGVIITALTIVVSYYQQKNLKEISYEIIYESSLLSVSKEVESRLQILLDGNPVKGVHLILFRIANTGNLPILPTDYHKNLNILFDGNSKVLTAEITNKIPKDIDTTISFTNKTVSFSSSLLNGGDAIVVKVLVSEFDGNIEVAGRIVGVKNIKRLRSSVSSSSKFFLIASIMSPLLGFLLNSLIKWEYGSIFFFTILVSYILIVFPISYDRRYRDIVFEILNNLGIKKTFHWFVSTIIIPATIIFFGVTTSTEVKCSLGIESERACLTRIELIIQTTEGIPLSGAQATYIDSGSPSIQYSDSNGYTTLLAKSKDNLEVKVAAQGFETNSFTINLANNYSDIRIITMKRSK